MIFVTLGTHDHPFTRLLDLVRPLADDHELVVQHGHTPSATGTRARWIRFISYEEMLEFMTAAETVITHGGVGSIVTALSVGKTPLVVPRLRRYGEHVDDHQLQIVRALVASGHVVALLEEGELSERIAETRAASRLEGARGSGLRRAVADAVASTPA